MGETYEVNLLSNVHAVDNKTSVSKELTEQRKKRAADNKRRKGGRIVQETAVVHVAGRASYLHDGVVEEQEGTIDITV